MKKDWEMKKYRLIKEYPGSPGKGSVTTVETFDDRVITDNPSKLYDIYPEFWEEVIDTPEYEILSFRGSDYTFTLRENGEYVNIEKDNSWGGFRLELGLGDEALRIRSIKRKSDGEVFTIGDKVRLNINRKDVIKTVVEFIIDKQESNLLWIKTNNDLGTELTTLNNYCKADILLFYTEDNVPVYEGDEYWYCWKDCRSASVIRRVGDKHSGEGMGLVYFSTKEAAEAYVAKNRVLFVTEDGVVIKERDTFWVVGDNFLIGYYAYIASTEKGQERYYKNNKTFSTKEKAQEYVDNHKPKFSLVDIETVFLRYSLNSYDHQGLLDDFKEFKK